MSFRGRSQSPRVINGSDHGMDVDDDVLPVSNGDKRQSDNGRDSATTTAAKVIIIHNLTRNVLEVHLRGVFEHYGKIRKIDFPTYKKSGQTRGKAALEYYEPSSAEDAVTHMNNGQLDGAIVKVETSHLPLPKSRSRSRSPRRRGPSPVGPMRTNGLALDLGRHAARVPVQYLDPGHRPCLDRVHDRGQEDAQGPEVALHLVEMAAMATEQADVAGEDILVMATTCVAAVIVDVVVDVEGTVLQEALAAGEAMDGHVLVPHHAVPLVVGRLAGDLRVTNAVVADLVAGHTQVDLAHVRVPLLASVPVAPHHIHGLAPSRDLAAEAPRLGRGLTRLTPGVEAAAPLGNECEV
ncbi:hypothetical protein FRB96_008715 [Tulasnella sp. 330]|nr:hypothetical protein FRB96_008715 [Tulasnella sp. 330]KAG8887782.1 hypothetical protein FRB98_009042 [Tulasnella sp. 332]